MSGNKLDVLWSPIHHDKFIVWGQDITLYDVARLQDIEKRSTYTKLSSARGATVVASQSASGVRCVDISAIVEHPDPLLALGHASGRVTLTSLKQTYDPLGLVGREFVARYPRPCISVAWNRTETNLLAVGMEKHRSDNCILLWDVHSCNLDEFDESSSPPASEPARPVAEVGMGETAHSVSWCGFAPRTLVASMNLKHIKIFDLREGGEKASGTASSRQCLGAVCEAAGWRVAARGDAGVCVWDARALARPLLTLPTPRPPRRLLWCPTRRNLLISLQRDSSTLRLHDIQQAHDYKLQQSFDSVTSAAAALEEMELEDAPGGALERDVAVCGAQLAAFACHPAQRARLLVLTAAGALCEYTVSERVTPAWGAAGELTWAGGGALRRMQPSFYSHVRDISDVMRARAQTDYGLKPDLWQNADLAEDEALSGLWHFLALSKSLVEDGCIRNSPWKHPGVRCVLRSPGEGYRSEAAATLLPDLPSRKVTTYRSAERTRALQLCGWGWGWDSAGAGVERAEAEGTPCRAAALAAFHLRLRAALDVLARARAPALRVAALALAPCAAAAPDERLWREALAAAAPALPDPYLRALLHFLAAALPPSAPQPHAPDYTAVLNETEMRLEDRVAFACIYLPDGALHEYVSAQWNALRARGSLAALLLAGVSGEGVGALQRWLERTGDVQSAALLAARCAGAELLRDARVRGWLAAYRALLDAWRLWWPRCLLDSWAAGAAGGAGGAGGEAAGAGVACTYCGKPVAAAASARPRPAFARLPPPAAKMKQISSCPNCRKPLPRCGVCSLHLGTGATGAVAAPAAASAPAPSAPAAPAPAPGAAGAHFGGWFSWCVACRHGGHAAHLLQWFSEHSECPVSSCTCRCSALDPPDPPRVFAPLPPHPPAPTDS